MIGSQVRVPLNAGQTVSLSVLRTHTLNLAWEECRGLIDEDSSLSKQPTTINAIPVCRAVQTVALC